MVKVKICGVTRAEDARVSAEAGASAIGINFAPESKRYIGSVERAAELVRTAALKAPVAWAGVFVNASISEIERAVRDVPLSIVQLHGDETPNDVAALRTKLPSGTLIWKVIRVASAADLAELPKFSGADAWLLDARYEGARGGEGKSFDWSLLKTLTRAKPIVLAGGLHPENVRGAVASVRPEWVDVASGVESKPGIKDAAKIERFVREATA